VVSNVMQGERPTKNLLANLLFAWLLDRFFRAVPGRPGAPGGGRGGTRPEPPGKNPPRPEPPETEPPDTQPPRTQPPDTEPPDTQPPGTQPPKTQPPSTQPPERLPPTPVRGGVRTLGVDEPVPGPRTLTAGEVAELQAIADRYQTQIDVGGSRAASQGRNIENPDLPVGKGEGTRSDIDCRIEGQRDIDSRGRLSDDIVAVSNGAGRVMSAGLPEIPSHSPVIQILPNRP